MLPENVNRRFSHSYVTTATWLTTIIKCIMSSEVLKYGKGLSFRIQKTGHSYLKLETRFHETMLIFLCYALWYFDLFYSISLKTCRLELIHRLRTQFENTRWIDQWRKCSHRGRPGRVKVLTIGVSLPWTLQFPKLSWVVSIGYINVHRGLCPPSYLALKMALGCPVYNLSWWRTGGQGCVDQTVKGNAHILKCGGSCSRWKCRRGRHWWAGWRPPLVRRAPAVKWGGEEEPASF